MKKIISAALILLVNAFAFAELAVPFFGNNNFTIDVDTTFTADTNDGSTGLLTTAGFGLWFEFTPYADRNITPQRDAVSVSLKLANSAFYAWRGYDASPGGAGGGYIYGDSEPSDITQDQATSIWFDTFIAQLEYNQWWVRIAGIEPEISISQASIRSVFDPVIANRTDIAKNRMPFPLFYVPGNAVGGNWSHGQPGITGLLSRDIVNLNRREVVIAGNLSAGMSGEIFDFTLKAGSWLKAEDNNKNAWVAGGDVSWRPDLAQRISFSLLAASNYERVTVENGDPLSDPLALEENPIALGLGYEYRFSLPNRMALRPYAGIDFIYETKNGEYNVEFGGGLQWFFRGTGSAFKRNAKIGGLQIGDVEIPAALAAGVNVDKNGFVNMVISFNEDPRTSPLPNVGGFLQAELMNMSGKEYRAPDGKNYNDFLWAGIVQVEYLLHGKIMPYVFCKYLPADMRLVTELAIAPVYSKDLASVTSKLGCRFTPINYFSVDVWYERTDVRISDDWTADNGAISIMFAVWNY
jgi:hypothetical protein